MKRLTCLVGIAVLLGLSACSPDQVDEPQDAENIEQSELIDPDAEKQFGLGETIAESVCAGCHAIRSDDESRHADAPPFRTLSAKYPLESLAEPLAERIMVGHPDMPEFQFETPQIEALLMYIESVQPEAEE